MTFSRILLLGAATLAILAARAPVTYDLPPESIVSLPDGPDADLVAGHCAACHSLDYILTQPRDRPPTFWRDTVTKMVNAYGAPIDSGDAERISSYLQENFSH